MAKKAKAKAVSMGLRLQNLRKAAGLSQTDLAKLANVPIGTLRGWEQDRRVPRLDAAIIIADALNITLDELAGRQLAGEK